jgi:hypothetical protein
MSSPQLCTLSTASDENKFGIQGVNEVGDKHSQVRCQTFRQATAKPVTRRSCLEELAQTWRLSTGERFR